MLRQELKENYPLASYSGFAIAAATGVLRLYNNKHWLSDVVGGAVLGVLSAKAAYWYFNKRNKRKTASATP